MNQGVASDLTVCLVTFNRPSESEVCLRSVHQHILAPHQTLFLSNGGDHTKPRQWYDEGLIDTLVLNRRNWGGGIAYKQAAQAALTEWVMLVQTDQIAVRPYAKDELDYHIGYCLPWKHTLYIDLAGNQGHGRASERALLINRRRYLDLPGFDEIIGGPGPFAQSKWTEQHLQEHCPGFGSAPLLFADNGAWSEREYPVEYGVGSILPRTKHRTDTKKLLILSPFGRRADGFPNLNLTDEEWRQVLAGEWPAEGKIPEQDRAHSFTAWPE